MSLDFEDDMNDLRSVTEKSYNLPDGGYIYLCGERFRYFFEEKS